MALMMGQNKTLGGLDRQRSRVQRKNYYSWQWAKVAGKVVASFAAGTVQVQCCCTVLAIGLLHCSCVRKVVKLNLDVTKDTEDTALHHWDGGVAGDGGDSAGEQRWTLLLSAAGASMTIAFLKNETFLAKHTRHTYAHKHTLLCNEINCSFN